MYLKVWFYIYILIRAHIYTPVCVYIYRHTYMQKYIYIYIHAQIYIQNYNSECDRKKWNWLNVCKELNTSTVSSCETSGSWENWSINLRFIQVLQLTWESRIEPGGGKKARKEKHQTFSSPSQLLIKIEKLIVLVLTVLEINMAYIYNF